MSTVISQGRHCTGGAGNVWSERPSTAPCSESAVTWMLRKDVPAGGPVRWLIVQKNTKWVDAGTPAVGFLPESQAHVPCRAALPLVMLKVAEAEKAAGHSLHPAGSVGASSASRRNPPSPSATMVGRPVTPIRVHFAEGGGAGAVVGAGGAAGRGVAVGGGTGDAATTGAGQDLRKASSPGVRGPVALISSQSLRSAGGARVGAGGGAEAAAPRAAVADRIEATAPFSAPRDDTPLMLEAAKPALGIDAWRP